MSLKTQQKGFTLIELLVVVAIIGLLASIILASLNTARQKGRDARRVSDMKEIQTALELYYSDLNHYPIQATAGVATTILGGSTGSNGPLTTSGKYMSTVSDDPLGGSYHYYYITDATGLKYCLGSTLEGTPPPGASATCTNGLSLSVSYAVNP